MMRVKISIAGFSISSLDFVLLNNQITERRVVNLKSLVQELQSELDSVNLEVEVAKTYLYKRKGCLLPELGRTEVVLNSLNPQWIKKVIITYHFEVVQTLLFHVYDVDSQFHGLEEKMLKLDEQQLPGEGTCLLSEALKWNMLVLETL
ncbi:hypothetical protein L6452_44720 [Arctium lappa]|nr:hypothetical protein L6452_44720 [Arctium lappa]